MRQQNKLFLSPLFLILLFNSFTISLYFIFYEKSSEYNNDLLMLFFLIVTFIFFTFGYISVKKTKIINADLKTNNKSSFHFYLFILIAVYSFINTLFSYYPSLSVLIEAIFNPQGAYSYVKQTYRSFEGDNQSSFIGVVNTTISAFKNIYLLYGIFYWSKLNKFEKCILLLTFVLNLIYILLIGAMINLAQLFIILLPLLLLKALDNNWKTNLKIIGTSIVGTITLFYLLGTREVFSDANNFLNTLSGGLKGIVFYISHGYEGLSKSLLLQFNPSYGEVMFRGISSYFLNLFDIESRWDQSLLIQNEMLHSWPALQLWSTGYTWIASDISFFLIPFLFLFLGIITRNAWLAFLRNKDFIELLFVSNLFLFFLMLAANNQVFHTYSNAVFTIVITLLYYYRKFRVSREKRI